MNKNSKKGLLIGVATGVANGFFGSGGGTIIVPFMQKFLKIETKKSHATAIAVILPLSAISAAIYIYKVDFSFITAALVSLGGIAGGYFGAKLLGKIPDRWLHIIFGGFMLAAAVKMIL